MWCHAFGIILFCRAHNMHSKSIRVYAHHMTLNTTVTEWMLDRQDVQQPKRHTWNTLTHPYTVYLALSFVLLCQIIQLLLLKQMYLWTLVGVQPFYKWSPNELVLHLKDLCIQLIEVNLKKIYWPIKIILLYAGGHS